MRRIVLMMRLSKDEEILRFAQDDKLLKENISR